VPRGPEPPARMDVEAEPPPGGSVRLDWLEPIEPRVMLRYRIPGVGHPDRPAFDLMAAVLRGPRGLLATRVLTAGPRTALGAALTASASRNGSPGTFTLQARPARDEGLPALEAVLLDVVEDLRAGRVPPGVIERARKAMRLEWARVLADRDELGAQLGRFAVINTWQTLPALIDEGLATTPEQLREMAQRYLVPANRVIATARHQPPGPAPAQLTSSPAAVPASK